MRWAAFLLVLGVIVTTSYAQLSPEEAAQRLKEREAAQAAERAKLVTISQGELDDLKAQIESLEAQLAQLRAAASAAPKIVEVPALAVGETRDQVFDFLRRHPNEYEILNDDLSTPHVVRKVVVKTVERQGSNSIDSTSPGNVAANQNEAEKAHETTIKTGNQSEKLVLGHKAFIPVKVGEHTEFNGVTSTLIVDTRNQWVPVEKWTLKMTNGQVTAIDRDKM
jgi:hypothetical protein